MMEGKGKMESGALKETSASLEKHAPEVKICGITRMEDVEVVSSMEADYAGFILYFPKSKRNLSLDLAANLVQELKRQSPHTKCVAVTVSPTHMQMEEIVRAGFHLLQVHGVLEEDVLADCPIPIWRALNITDSIVTKEAMQSPKISGIVLDGKQPGSGECFDWELLEEYNRGDKLLILAGGLSPENVEEAIQRVHPDVMDVSSGVEYEGEFRGKDPKKVKAFIQEVRRWRRFIESVQNH